MPSLQKPRPVSRACWSWGGLAKLSWAEAGSGFLPSPVIEWELLREGVDLRAAGGTPAVSPQQPTLQPWGSSEDRDRLESPLNLGWAPTWGSVSFWMEPSDRSHLSDPSRPVRQPRFIICETKTSSFFPGHTCTSVAQWLAREGRLEDDSSSQCFLRASVVPGGTLNTPSTWTRSCPATTQCRGCACFPRKKPGPGEGKCHCQG